MKISKIQSNITISYKDLVKVKFVDPADYDARFSEDFAPAVMEAIGVIVDSKHCVKLAWLFDENGEYEAGLALPRGCVISIEKVGRTISQ